MKFNEQAKRKIKDLVQSRAVRQLLAFIGSIEENSREEAHEFANNYDKEMRLRNRRVTN